MTKPALHIRGVVLPDVEPRDLWIADGKIVDAPPANCETIATNCWVLPGLVDAHCHIGLGSDGRATTDEVAIEQAKTDRDAGVLLVRSPGCPADTRWIDDRGDLPKLVRAGRHIGRTKRYVRNLSVEIEPEQLVAEVETQANSINNDGWIKVVGDWIDRSVGDLAPCWPTEVIKPAIDKAHELGCKVTTHVFAEQSVADFVAAGVDCVEHGTGLSPAVIAQMAAQGTALVPTMTNLANFPHYADQGAAKFPVYANHIRDLHRRRHETIGMAREAGVQIYCGTDAGTYVPHGLAPKEIVLLGEVGSPSFALGAGSWRARTWLGHDNLTTGADADLVVYGGDPMSDLHNVLTPDYVILRGEIVAGIKYRG